jgi:hypothetical protein
LKIAKLPVWADDKFMVYLKRQNCNFPVKLQPEVDFHITDGLFYFHKLVKTIKGSVLLITKALPEVSIFPPIAQHKDLFRVKFK